MKLSYFLSGAIHKSRDMWRFVDGNLKWDGPKKIMKVHVECGLVGNVMRIWISGFRELDFEKSKKIARSRKGGRYRYCKNRRSRDLRTPPHKFLFDKEIHIFKIREAQKFVKLQWIFESSTFMVSFSCSTVLFSIHTFTDQLSHWMT